MHPVVPGVTALRVCSNLTTPWPLPHAMPQFHIRVLFLPSNSQEVNHYFHSIKLFLYPFLYSSNSTHRISIRLPDSLTIVAVSHVSSNFICRIASNKVGNPEQSASASAPRHMVSVLHLTNLHVFDRIQVFFVLNMQFTKLVVAAATFAFASAQSVNITNSNFAGITVGTPFIITWTGATSDITLKLKNGPANAQLFVETIGSKFAKSFSLRKMLNAGRRLNRIVPFLDSRVNSRGRHIQL